MANRAADVDMAVFRGRGPGVRSRIHGDCRHYFCRRDPWELRTAKRRANRTLLAAIAGYVLGKATSGQPPQQTTVPAPGGQPPQMTPPAPGEQPPQQSRTPSPGGQPPQQSTTPAPDGQPSRAVEDAVAGRTAAATVDDSPRCGQPPQQSTTPGQDLADSRRTVDPSGARRTAIAPVDGSGAWRTAAACLSNPSGDARADPTTLAHDHVTLMVLGGSFGALRSCDQVRTRTRRRPRSLSCEKYAGSSVNFDMAPRRAA